MFALLLALFMTSGCEPFDIQEVYLELSMDTYKYGMDASPLVNTYKGISPKIDSLYGDSLYGTIAGRHLIWNSVGKCVTPKCRKGENLTWSAMWYDTLQ